METFCKARDFVQHTHYERDRASVISNFVLEDIDEPIRDIMTALLRVSQCFSLQSCYGHFIWKGQHDEHNLCVLPSENQGLVRYRIAYLALCIKKGTQGAHLRECLASIREIDVEYVQFGSPDWFWQKYPNSYALQVEPKRFAFQDQAILEHIEAQYVQSVRDKFFQRIRDLVGDRENQFGAV
jgi:hypothetical protein